MTGGAACDGYTFPMRRWLAILILALLPLQFSWAVVAPYCQHESSTQSTHFGHHEHEHAADGEARTGDATKLAGEADFDCNQCHGACAGLPILAVTTEHFVPSAHPMADSARSTPPGSPERPERPQWPLPA